MRLRFYILAVFICFSFGYSQQTLRNLDDARAEVREYYESGRYNSELKNIIDKAVSGFEKEQLPENATAIFDVDDTVLSSYEYTSSLGFGFSWETWENWMNEAKCKKIPEVIKLYDWLVKKGVKIIFLTGRHDDTKEGTRINLIKKGFTQIDSLICRNPREENLPAANYKTAHRKALSESGFNIVVCVGDQESDLQGDYTGKKIKLPNYLYT